MLKGILSILLSIWEPCTISSTKLKLVPITWSKHVIIRSTLHVLNSETKIKFRNKLTSLGRESDTERRLQSTTKGTNKYSNSMAPVGLIWNTEWTNPMHSSSKQTNFKDQIGGELSALKELNSRTKRKQPISDEWKWQEKLKTMRRESSHQQ